QAAEAVLLMSVGLIIHSLYLGGEEALYVPLMLGTVLLANILFNVAQTHRVAMYRSSVKQGLRVLAAWTLAFTIVAVGLVLFKASELVSRVWLVGWFVAGALVLIAFRLALRALVQQWTSQGKLKQRTVIVGGGHDAEVLIDAIHQG